MWASFCFSLVAFPPVSLLFTISLSLSLSFRGDHFDIFWGGIQLVYTGIDRYLELLGHCGWPCWSSSELCPVKNEQQTTNSLKGEKPKKFTNGFNRKCIVCCSLMKCTFNGTQWVHFIYIFFIRWSSCHIFDIFTSFFF